jgi:protein kinase A
MKQTLGFLKKKRTKDPSAKDSESSSQPNSPITPTSSRGFHNSIASISTNSTAPTSQDTGSPTFEQQPMTQGVTHQQQAFAASHAAESPVRVEQQNLPSISNLIHPSPPQNDGAAQSYSAQMSSNTSSTPAASGANSAAHAPQLNQVQQPTQIRQTKGKYSLGDFELLRTLGTGSFGRVHLVQSKHNSRFYAVKVLKKQQVVKMKQVEHTNDERRMLQEVKHPFLVTLWGTFQDSKNLYMVMDFVEGGELFSLLRKSQVC